MALSREEHRLEAIAKKAYAANKPRNLVPPQTFGNATTKGCYTTPVWPVGRPGQDEHLACASVGMTAQIKRVV